MKRKRFALLTLPIFAGGCLVVSGCNDIYPPSFKTHQDGIHFLSKNQEGIVDTMTRQHVAMAPEQEHKLLAALGVAIDAMNRRRETFTASNPGVAGGLMDDYGPLGLVAGLVGGAGFLGRKTARGREAGQVDEMRGELNAVRVQLNELITTVKTTAVVRGGATAVVRAAGS